MTIVNDFMELDSLFKEVYAKHFLAIKIPYTEWTVDHWLKFTPTDSEKRKYKNAKRAHEIQNSKLSKILK